MPASMMSEATGSKLKVIGSSIAMVAVGPMPGRQPTIVPSSTPTKHQRTLVGVSAVAKPSSRLASSSIEGRSDADPGAEERHRHAERLDEDEDAERCQP